MSLALVSILGCIIEHKVLIMGVQMLVITIALNQATNWNIHLLNVGVSSICIFYTCVGGVRAVVWTDLLQGFFIAIGVLLIVFKGTYDIGNLLNIFNLNIESGRIELPEAKLSFTNRRFNVATAISLFILDINACLLQQTMAQRYISLPTLKQGERNLIVFLILKVIFHLLFTYMGFMIYAKYATCDPISSKVVRSADQLILLLVTEVLDPIPGAAGLFIAGVCSATLSCLSSHLNSVAAIILEDFYRPFRGSVTEREANIVVRGAVVITGLLIILMTFISGKLGTLFDISVSIVSATSGPVVAIFVLALLVPWVTSKGVFYGSIMGILFVVWMYVGNRWAVAAGTVKYPKKSLSIDGCDFNVTIAPNLKQNTKEIELFFLYRISSYFYSLIGLVVTIISSIIISYLTHFNKIGSINIQLLAPCIRKYFTLKSKNSQEIAKEYLEMASASENENLLQNNLNIKTKTETN